MGETKTLVAGMKQENKMWQMITLTLNDKLEIENTEVENLHEDKHIAREMYKVFVIKKKIMPL